VVEEKVSRVIEVLLAAIKPDQLLLGKVIGIGMVGLIQIAAIIAAGFAAALLFAEIDLPSSTAATAVTVVVFFILGYALYAFAFGTAGALVSRQEDAGTATTPLLMVLVGGYVASTMAISDPHGTLASVLMYVPP